MSTANDSSSCVEFEQGTDDLEALTRYQIGHSKPIRRARWFMLFGIPSICVLAMVATWPNDIRDAFPFSIITVFLVVYVAHLLVYDRPRSAVKRLIAKPHGKRMLGPVRLEISPNEIRSQSNFGTSEISWTAVDALAATPEYLFLFVGENEAFIVPRRAFQSDSAFQRFEQRVRQYLQTAPAIGVFCPHCRYDLSGVSRSRCPECGWQAPQ